MSEPPPKRFDEALLEGPVATQAKESIERVADHLSLARPRPADRFDLGSGSAGIAHALATLASLFERSDWEEAARTYWDAALQAVAHRRSKPGLFPGFSGLAWVAAHHGRLFNDDTGEGFYADIDVALTTFLEDSHWSCYDLISGWVGLGVYVLERWPERQDLLFAVLSRLRRARMITGEGVTWFTPLEVVPASQRASAPKGYLNLGMAHGVPGVVSFLAQTQSLGLLDASDERDLELCVDWLLKQRVVKPVGLQFASWLAPGGRPSVSRLGWCYGDLGVAAALVLAGRLCQRQDWTASGVALAKRLRELPEEDARIRDHGLCHGAAGVGHVLHCMARMTGEEELFDLARRWMQRTLDMRERGIGIDGYATWTTDATSADKNHKAVSHWETDPGFLTGAAGVALALASAIKRDAPAWDRVLLISSKHGPTGRARKSRMKLGRESG